MLSETEALLHAHLTAAEDERDDLRATGDLMQSSLSRLVAWIEDNADRIPALGYEVEMAKLEGKSAVEQWTTVRRRANAPLSESRASD